MHLLLRQAGVLGMQGAHSGTVAGFLFEPGRGAAGRIERARAGLAAWDAPQSRVLPPSPRKPEDVP
ncbi:MAG TPA: hypothetical protein VLK84_30635 [Longimicrobium sp.]|nr:hypothetical protein [Longimicrobium sp.]